MRRSRRGRCAASRRETLSFSANFTENSSPKLAIDPAKFFIGALNFELAQNRLNKIKSLLFGVARQVQVFLTKERPSVFALQGLQRLRE